MAGLVPPGTTMLGGEAASAKKINEVDKKVDYLNLPCPIPYEELHREALSSVSSSLFPYFILLILDLSISLYISIYVFLTDKPDLLFSV